MASFVYSPSRCRPNNESHSRASPHRTRSHTYTYTTHTHTHTPAQAKWKIGARLHRPQPFSLNALNWFALTTIAAQRMKRWEWIMTMASQHRKAVKLLALFIFRHRTDYYQVLNPTTTTKIHPQPTKSTNLQHPTSQHRKAVKLLALFIFRQRADYYQVLTPTTTTEIQPQPTKSTNLQHHPTKIPRSGNR